MSFCCWAVLRARIEGDGKCHRSKGPNENLMEVCILHNRQSRLKSNSHG